MFKYLCVINLYLQQSNTANEAPHAQRWNSLQTTRGSFGQEDCLTDEIVEIMFDYPIFIKVNMYSFLYLKFEAVYFCSALIVKLLYRKMSNTQSA